MRIHSMRPTTSATSRSPRRSPSSMPDVGSDEQRGGWYDVVERVREPGREVHRFVWHDRKAWWQQEQGILAYLILAGSLGNAEYAAPRPRVGRLLQRLLPRPRRRRRLLQRPGQRHPVPARHRAAEGQPLDERLPLDRAVLPGRGLHQPADHQAAAGPVLQARARAPSRTTSCGSRRTSCRPAASGSARSGSTASRTPTSTPTA